MSLGLKSLKAHKRPVLTHQSFPLNSDFSVPQGRRRPLTTQLLTIQLSLPTHSTRDGLLYHVPEAQSPPDRERNPRRRVQQRFPSPLDRARLARSVHPLAPGRVAADAGRLRRGLDHPPAPRLRGRSPQPQPGPSARAEAEEARPAAEGRGRRGRRRRAGGGAGARRRPRPHGQAPRGREVGRRRGRRGHHGEPARGRYQAQRCRLWCPHQHVRKGR
mmetsp:Transcript_55986/g.135075  ORF Transcript_55986/g.135075 Transcript_55986/m.135075 type:complete len:217 (-) Transcript_55986:2256-2906(-)